MAEALPEDVGAQPSLAGGQEGFHRRLEPGQIQEDVFGLTQHGRLAVERAAGLAQGRGVEELAATVALVSARRGIAAGRACTLDVTVWQEAA